MSNQQPETTGTFHTPCLQCGASVDTVGGVRQPHGCRPTDSKSDAIARAYWAGHDIGWQHGEYFGSNK